MSTNTRNNILSMINLKVISFWVLGILAYTSCAGATQDVADNFLTTTTTTTATTMTATMTNKTERTLDNHCSLQLTCKTCTQQAGLCHWSVYWQSCSAQPNRRMNVNATLDCPVLTTTYNRRRGYIVKINNDVVGLIKYLKENYTLVECWRGPTGPSFSQVLDYGKGTGQIDCSSHPIPKAVSQSNSTNLASSFYVTFGPNETMLHTDDRAEFYASPLYDRNCSSLRWSRYCMTCNNTGNGRRLYVQQCFRMLFGDNRCVDWSMDDDDSELSHEYKLDAVDRERCEHYTKTVAHFHPAEVAWDANDTTVTITVHGHGELAQNGYVHVTVAGHECADPIVVSENQFTCIVRGTLTAQERSGTVRVVYGPDYRMRRPGGAADRQVHIVAVTNTKESHAMFRFTGPAETTRPCHPTLLPAQAYAGMVSGGTKMLVRWTALQPECVDREHPIEFYAERDDGVRYVSSCEIVANSTTDMWCFTPDVGSVTEGMAAHEMYRDGPIARFRCGFQLLGGGRSKKPLNVPCGGPPGPSAYVAFADPVFEEYDVITNGSTTSVVLNGSYLGSALKPQDYQIILVYGDDNDENINNNYHHTPCIVRSLTVDRIECSPSANDEYHENGEADLKRILIYVGNVKTVFQTGDEMSFI